MEDHFTILFLHVFIIFQEAEEENKGEMEKRERIR